ncbi:MAG: ribosome silencing factor [Fimbriimonadaceae bacterium]
MTKKLTKNEMNSRDKAKLVAEFADDMKALDIETLDIKAKTSIADYFIVCTGTSDVHIRAICERVAEKLREVGIRPVRQSDRSETGGGWMLFDYGDVVLHVMLEEKRQFYDLESFWKNLPQDPSLIIDEPAPAESLIPSDK